MKINQSCFILGVQQKTNKDGEGYLIVNIADMEGITYSIVTKEFELMKLEQFKQYNLQLQLTNGKYGMKLDIIGINE